MKVSLLICAGDQTKDGLKQVFDIPHSPYEQWYDIKMKIKAANKGFAVADSSIVSTGYILVKKRWYHSLYERFWVKYRKPKDKVGMA